MHRPPNGNCKILGPFLLLIFTVALVSSCTQRASEPNVSTPSNSPPENTSTAKAVTQPTTSNPIPHPTKTPTPKVMPVSDTPTPQTPTPSPTSAAAISIPILNLPLSDPALCAPKGEYTSKDLIYLGPLIDAHVHLEIWGFTYPIEKLITVMQKAGVVKFVVHDDPDIAEDAYNKYPDIIIPFVRVSPRKDSALNTITAALEKDTFYGVGEISLRHWSKRMDTSHKEPTSIEGQKRKAGGGKGEETPGDSEEMKNILDIAANSNVPAAVHLDNLYSDELERLLEHNRSGNIIWSHVGTTPMKMTDPKDVVRMMEDHPNLYADLSAISPFMHRESLLDTNGVLQKEWVNLLEAYNERFFFGIDIFLEEHIESVESEVLYWRKILGQLEPETARGIGCGNIQGMLNK